MQPLPRPGVGTTCVFYDVTEGDLDVNCMTGTPNCFGGTAGNFDGVLSTGGVSGLTLLTNGSGYTSAPTCTISAPQTPFPYNGYPGGSQATCTATSNGLQVTGVTLTNAGAGYAPNPLCTLSGGGGSGGTCSVSGVTIPSYQPSFAATPGWDFATGIGTPNVYNLDSARSGLKDHERFSAMREQKGMMKSPSGLRCRCVKVLPLGGVLALAIVTSGQQAALRLGVPDDWTHRHVVFSNPGTFAEAVQNGTYEQWARVVSDPRFAVQQRKRAATARAQMSFPLTALRMGGETEPADVETTGDAEEPENPFVGAGKPAREREDEGEDRGERHRRHRRKARSRQHLDWSVNMGAGATLGLGVYPAKFSFGISSANCGTAPSPDFVVYGTSLAGSATQASIAAFDNLYTGCRGTVPTVFWAYNTGGTIITSVAFSLDGKEVAFVQTTGTSASLVILKWAAGTGTLGAPDTPTNAAPAAYRACAAPCMTAIPFSGGANDTGSSVYTDYSSNTILRATTVASCTNSRRFLGLRQRRLRPRPGPHGP